MLEVWKVQNILYKARSLYLLLLCGYETSITLVFENMVVRGMRSRRMRVAGHAARMGEKRKAYKILNGKIIEACLLQC